MPRYSDAKIITALRRAKGMVHIAAGALGCSVNTIYDRIKSSPKVAAVRQDEDGKVNDIAEIKLISAIDAGEQWAIKYRLDRKARDRGYGEKVEVDGKIEAGQVSEADRAALIDALMKRIGAMEHDRSQETENNTPAVVADGPGGAEAGPESTPDLGPGGLQ